MHGSHLSVTSLTQYIVHIHPCFLHHNSNMKKITFCRVTLNTVGDNHFTSAMYEKKACNKLNWQSLHLMIFQGLSQTFAARYKYDTVTATMMHDLHLRRCVCLYTQNLVNRIPLDANEI